MKRILLSAALAAFFCKLCVGVALAATPAERVSAFIQSTKTFKANFTQTLVAKAGRKPQVSSGSVLLMRPGKFRWQVDKPYPQLMVGDGQKVWLYDPDLKQVTIRKMGDTLSGTPAALLAGDHSFEKNFALKEGLSADGIDWVEATPKGQDASFSRIRMGFRGDQLVAMEMNDNFGQTTLIHFSAVERNPAIAASQFRFVPPAGVDVVGE